MSIGLGVDTGGTYTDAVVIDMVSGKILAKSKALTTRNDLVIGIDEALSKFDPALLRKISLTSISSTLATNSMVEGKGCRVGAVSIGREYNRATPANIYAQVGGRHDLDGNETEPFDEDGCRAALEKMRNNVDAVAIAGYLSVRNPDHEERAARLAKEILNVPIVCGHDLTSNLGFNERMTTAVMNARLIPVIAELISSVKKSMERFGIDSTLVIVKGDGSVMNTDTAVEKPVETVLSGPASSLIGAKTLSGCDDSIVVDIGGTTTDIGVLRSGFPRLEDEGATINGLRTRVKAVSVSTFGIGGDSRIVVNGKDIILCQVRVIPLCIASVKYPRIAGVIKGFRDRKPSSAPNNSEPCRMRQDLEFFVSARPPTTEALTDMERRFLEVIKDCPLTLSEAESVLGETAMNYPASKLEKLGLVTRIGMTPTDILHAEGTYMEYDAVASKTVVDYNARKCRISTEEFIWRVKRMVVEKIAVSIMRDLILEESGTVIPNDTDSDLLLKAVSGKGGKDFTVSIRLDKPIVGIGAPVRAWLPEVSKIFGTKLVIPDDAEIGNAVGAISGYVSEKEIALIRPVAGDLSGNPGCFVFMSNGRMTFYTLDDGIAFAVKNGTKIVTEKAIRSGASNVKIESSIEKKTYSNASESGGESLLECTVTVTATGKPRFVSGSSTRRVTLRQRCWGRGCR